MHSLAVHLSPAAPQSALTVFARVPSIHIHTTYRPYIAEPQRRLFPLTLTFTVADTPVDGWKATDAILFIIRAALFRIGGKVGIDTSWKGPAAIPYILLYAIVIDLASIIDGILHTDSLLRITDIPGITILSAVAF